MSEYNIPGKINSIQFPNNCSDVQGGCSISADENTQINRMEKSGEMADIGWFQIIRNGSVFAEIKESVCNIYYDPPKTDKETE